MKRSGSVYAFTEAHYEAKTLLDKALDNYSKAAERYYAKQDELNNASDNVREQRAKELEEIKRMLDSQRMNAECMASVQAGLDAYREFGRQATIGNRSEFDAKQAILLAEEHHPTERLQENMLANLDPKPGPNHTAHHIVPGKGKTRFANLARVHMHSYAIRINDPDNGVWLPTYKKHTPSWAMPESKGHLEYHTEKYEEWLSMKIRMKRSEVFIRTELTTVGKMLRTNTLPPEARAIKK